MPTPEDPKHEDRLFNYAMGEFNRRLDGIDKSVQTIGSEQTAVQREHVAALQGIQKSIEDIRLGMVRADGTRDIMAAQILALQASDKAILDGQAAANARMTEQHGKLAEQTNKLAEQTGKLTEQAGKIDVRVQHIEMSTDRPGIRTLFGAIGSLVATLLAAGYFFFGKEPPAAILSLINARPPTH
jgi:hypothetical protein